MTTVCPERQALYPEWHEEYPSWRSEGYWVSTDDDDGDGLLIWETNLDELARRKGIDPAGLTNSELGALLYADDEEEGVREVPSGIEVTPPRPTDVAEVEEFDHEAYVAAAREAIRERQAKGAGPETEVEAEVEQREGGKPDDDDLFGAAGVVDYVVERFELGRASDGKLIAVPKEGPRIARNLSSMKQPVAAAIYSDRRRTPGQTTLATAFGILDGLAAEAEPIQVHLRAAHDYREGAVYVDLGDAEKTIVRVDRNGWTLSPERTPVFRRTSATRALPRPRRDGTTRADFAALLGLDVESDEFLLVWGWLVAAFFSDIPRPILWATGEQGSGKTTRAKMILNLVDPADELGGNIGKNERDDSTAAAGRFVATYDNLRHISEATSDWICRLVTGVTIDRRALYTDDGVHTSVLQRTGIATSINLPYGLGPDAVERLITLTFPRVPESARKTERALEEEYESLRPGLFGALLADVAGVLAHIDRVSVEELPRMADYAVTLHALDLATGGRFAEAYERQAKRALAARAEDDPFLAAIVKIAKRGPQGVWEGTAKELVSLVAYEVNNATNDTHGIPGERTIKGALMASATSLRSVGVTVSEARKTSARLIILRYSAEDDAAEG